MEFAAPRPELPAHWMPPPSEKLKINVDGAVFTSQKAAGVGILVRDEGRTIGACGKKIWTPLGAVEVKAKAVEFGLQFAKDLLIQDFILEGDSLVLINAMKEVLPPPSVAAIVFTSLSAIHGFRQVEFSHVP